MTNEEINHQLSILNQTYSSLCAQLGHAISQYEYWSEEEERIKKEISRLSEDHKQLLKQKAELDHDSSTNKSSDQNSQST